MRMLMVALLAGAALAAPVAAQNDARAQRQVAREGMRQALGGGDRQDRREFRQERREARQESRGDRQGFREERREDRQGFRQERREDRQEFRAERRDDRQNLQQGEVNRREFRRDRAQDVREFQRDRARDVREFRRDRIQDGRDYRRDQARDGRWGYDGNRWGWNNNDRRGGNWNRDWRRDPRYNYQDWRRNNRGYNFGRYYAPRGWGFGYRQFSLGAILSAPLFAQNYWIDDPFDYRLPPAYGPYRWVRYYDDVILVDTRDGRVVDVIHSFFG